VHSDYRGCLVVGNSSSNIIELILSNISVDINDHKFSVKLQIIETRPRGT